MRFTGVFTVELGEKSRSVFIFKRFLKACLSFQEKSFIFAPALRKPFPLIKGFPDVIRRGSSVG